MFFDARRIAADSPLLINAAKVADATPGDGAFDRKIRSTPLADPVGFLRRTRVHEVIGALPITGRAVPLQVLALDSVQRTVSVMSDLRPMRSCIAVGPVLFRVNLVMRLHRIGRFLLFAPSRHQFAPGRGRSAQTIDALRGRARSAPAEAGEGLWEE
ncbi:hypothetical protein K461DRAFT_311696 [Myriangium duriaei CBS 260.36]|uniref:Uncharacterized protein n=1 Tax=Myriangium duriaei CBS 260.36 TaxID=1168546 RepID=A0A9P4JAI0_9PEZI|nr:hypothetical protein K461DRAFT_311696 [Myriangium duriaei CBS 260.36]